MELSGGCCSEERWTTLSSFRPRTFRYGVPCTHTVLVVVAGCDASSESLVLTMLVPTTSTLVSVVFLVGGVVVKFPPVDPKCTHGESHRSLFRSDDGGVFDVVASLEASSWSHLNFVGCMLSLWTDGRNENRERV